MSTHADQGLSDKTEDLGSLQSLGRQISALTSPLARKARKLRSSASTPTLRGRARGTEFGLPVPPLTLIPSSIERSAVLETTSPGSPRSQLLVFRTPPTSPTRPKRSPSPHTKVFLESPSSPSFQVHKERMDMNYLNSPAAQMKYQYFTRQAPLSRSTTPAPPPLPPRPRSTVPQYPPPMSAPPSTSSFESSYPMFPASPPPPLPARPEHLRHQASNYQDAGIRDITDAMQSSMRIDGDNDSLSDGSRKGGLSAQNALEDASRRHFGVALSRPNTPYGKTYISPPSRQTSLATGGVDGLHERLYSHSHTDHQQQSQQHHQEHPHSTVPHPPPPHRAYSEPTRNDYYADAQYHMPPWQGQYDCYPSNQVNPPPPQNSPNYGYYPSPGPFESPPSSPPYPNQYYSPPPQPYYPNMNPYPATYGYGYPYSNAPYPPPAPQPSEHKSHSGWGTKVGKYLGKGMANLSGQIMDNDVQNDIN